MRFGIPKQMGMPGHLLAAAPIAASNPKLRYWPLLLTSEYAPSKSGNLDSIVDYLAMAEAYSMLFKRRDDSRPCVSLYAVGGVLYTMQAAIQEN
jgi:hypothetical protein